MNSKKGFIQNLLIINLKNYMFDHINFMHFNCGYKSTIKIIEGDYGFGDMQCFSGVNISVFVKNKATNLNEHSFEVFKASPLLDANRTSDCLQVLKQMSDFQKANFILSKLKTHDGFYVSEKPFHLVGTNISKINNNLYEEVKQRATQEKEELLCLTEHGKQKTYHL